MLELRRLHFDDDDFARQLRRLRLLPEAQNAQVRRQVGEIIRRVRDQGDAALLELSAQLDGHRPSSAARLEVEQKEMDAAWRAVPANVISALKTAAARIADYHRRQIPSSWRFEDEYGNVLGERVRPLRRAAVYAPGGKAAYPSSALMGLVAAKTAGVEEVFLTAPAPGGVIAEVTLAAAAIGGATRVFRLGGAQAVAAFCFGTVAIPRADKIVGPGNVFVAEAKRQLFGEAGFDAPAGPSEVLIIGDGTAPAKLAAMDMMAQAEHDELAMSILVSPNGRYLDEVEQCLREQAPAAARADIILQSLQTRAAMIVARDINDCCRIADAVAAEHVQVMTEDAEQVAENIRNVGAVFIGAHSGTVLGDYCAGSNHILPTAGAARFLSPLGVHDFVKRTAIVRASETGAAKLAETAMTLAAAEGLYAHAESARMRAEKTGEN